MSLAQLLVVVPLLYGGAALIPERALAGRPARRWQLGLGAATLALVTAVTASAVGVLGSMAPSAQLAVGPVALSVCADPLTLVMLVLVTTIAVVILRFSRRYLAGEPGQPRFVRALLTALAAVTLLVIANHLLVIALAWTLTSFAVHRLLAFYDERPQAVIAAHKKFLMSRLADVAIFTAVALLWRDLGTLEVDAMVARMAESRSVSTSVQAAGVLLVIGVVLRSAQMPFHGWLIQVMEAPTPVSALLHAGIVNLGGFVLIRMGGVLVQLGAAQTLLVLVGTTTAVVAGLVMMTRVSVKVALAWSTCAQMGFMLLECGLGAYRLALLHLVAHSVYKAHAFLASGGTVEVQLRRALGPPAPGLVGWVVAAGLGLALVLVTNATLGLAGGRDGGGLASLLILGLALAPLLAPGAWVRSLALPGLAVGLVAAYAGWHRVSGHVVAEPDVALGLDPLRVGWVLVSFALLFAVQTVVRVTPRGRLARWLYPRAYAGFYLDEIFTRLTFALWPVRIAPVGPEAAPAPVAPAPVAPIALERA